ncbi:MAG: type I 3-dehydroquinate dehydratase [Clostridia bacterium]|nr:type I 3-dehydroquinate dehydratase [Clostridia bacterium]
MKPTFLREGFTPLTVILQCRTPEVAIGRIRNALCQGAEAFGLQAESLYVEHQNEAVFRKLFSEMKGRPIYVTNYRSCQNVGKSQEELAEGLVTLARCGATLCDVPGDMFAEKHPLELTEDPEAIQKQMALIDRLHEMGAEVLMSSHVKKYTPAETVLAIAREQKRRGADIIKIVVKANDMAEQLENMRINNLLKEELGAPFLFLSGGVCSLHRRLGLKLGCCMALCVYEHDENSTSAQPLLSTMKTVRDGIDF